MQLPTRPLPERPYADRPGYAAWYDERDLYDTDQDRWYREYGRYREQGRWLRYLVPPLVGLAWFLIGSGLLLADGNPSVDAILLVLLVPASTPLVSLWWWLHDRRRIDPQGHARRLRALGWMITAVWGASKLR